MMGSLELGPVSLQWRAARSSRANESVRSASALGGHQLNGGVTSVARLRLALRDESGPPPPPRLIIEMALVSRRAGLGGLCGGGGCVFVQRLQRLLLLKAAAFTVRHAAFTNRFFSPRLRSAREETIDKQTDSCQSAPRQTSQQHSLVPYRLVVNRGTSS